MAYSKKYEELRQSAFDKLQATYEEEGIQLAPYTFPISYFIAYRMANAKNNEDMGKSRPKYNNLSAAEVVGTEVVRDVFIIKEGKQYFLEYHDTDQMEKLLDGWVSM